MHRREYLTIGGVGLATVFSGCIDGIRDRSTPEPYELPEGASEDGLTDLEVLFESTVEGSVENTARVETTFQSGENDSIVQVMSVGKDAMFLKFERGGRVAEGYLNATNATGYLRDERDGEVTYEDLSDRIPEEDTLKSVFSDELNGSFSAVEEFDYELTEETTYKGRPAGHFESVGLNERGQDRYESGESDMMIDSTGWILNYSATTENSRSVTESEVTFSDIGETEVSEPDWLDEAKANT